MREKRTLPPARPDSRGVYKTLAPPRCGPLSESEISSEAIGQHVVQSHSAMPGIALNRQRGGRWLRTGFASAVTITLAPASASALNAYESQSSPVDRDAQRLREQQLKVLQQVEKHLDKQGRNKLVVAPAGFIG